MYFYNFSRHINDFDARSTFQIKKGMIKRLICTRHRYMTSDEIPRRHLNAQPFLHLAAPRGSREKRNYVYPWFSGCATFPLTRTFCHAHALPYEKPPPSYAILVRTPAR